MIFNLKKTAGTSASCSLRKCCLLMGIFLFARVSCSSFAQNSSIVPTLPDKDTLRKLETSLHIKPGAATLEAVMQTISQQTGLKVEAVDYLQGRHLIVNINSMSARDTLDTLAEMYDWRWFIPERGRIFLTRQRLRTTEKVSEVPKTIQKLIPVDFRRYIGIDVPTDDLPLLKNPNQQKLVQRLHALDKDRAREREERIKGRLTILVQQNTHKLFESLQPELEKGQPISYKQLNAEQKAMLKIVLVLGSFQLTNANSFAFFANNLQPYQLDPLKAEIRLENGNALMIGSVVNNVSTSEGAAIQGLQTKPPILPKLKNPLGQEP